MTKLDDIEKRRKKVYRKKHTSLIVGILFSCFIILGFSIVIVKELSPSMITDIDYLLEGELPIIQLVAVVVFLVLAFLLTRRPLIKDQSKKFNEYYIKKCLMEKMKYFNVETIDSANAFNQKSLLPLFLYDFLETLAYASGKWKGYNFEIGEVLISDKEWTHGTGNDSEVRVLKHNGTFMRIKIGLNFSSPVTITSKNFKQVTQKVEDKSLIKAISKFVSEDFDSQISFGNAFFSKNFFVSGDKVYLSYINNEIQNCLNNLVVQFPKTCLQFRENECLLFIEEHELLVPKQTPITEDYIKQQELLFELLNQFLYVLDSSVK